LKKQFGIWTIIAHANELQKIAAYSPSDVMQSNRRISGESISHQPAPVNIFTPNFAQPQSPPALVNNPGKVIQYNDNSITIRQLIMVLSNCNEHLKLD
jgi:hypothetical protein